MGLSLLLYSGRWARVKRRPGKPRQTRQTLLSGQELVAEESLSVYDEGAWVH